MAGNGVRSAKGAIVDFDLLKIKQQIAAAPKPVVVEARENFIDNKFKRQLKKQVREAIDLATDQVISATASQREPIAEKKTTKPEIKTEEE